MDGEEQSAVACRDEGPVESTVPQESEQSAPVPQESEQSAPVPQESVQSAPVPQKSEQSTPQESEQSAPVPQEAEQSAPVPQESKQSAPVLKESGENAPAPTGTGGATGMLDEDALRAFFPMDFAINPMKLPPVSKYGKRARKQSDDSAPGESEEGAPEEAEEGAETEEDQMRAYLPTEFAANRRNLPPKKKKQAPPERRQSANEGQGRKKKKKGGGGGWHEAEGEDTMECPYDDCDYTTSVDRMDRHVDRRHTLKYRGLRCLENRCLYIFNIEDSAGLKRHYKKHHGLDSFSGIKLADFEVKVSEGYYHVIPCDMCDYQGFNEKRMAKHKMVKHGLSDSTRLAEYLTKVAERSEGINKVLHTAYNGYGTNYGFGGDRWQRRRADLPAKTIAKLERCRVAGCTAEVANMQKHHKRNHEAKYWGFECECGFQTSQLDHTLFMRHRREQHDAGDSLTKQDVMESHKKDVPDGYYDMLRCELCNHRAFTKPDMEKHECKPDPERIKRQQAQAQAQLDGWQELAVERRETLPEKTVEKLEKCPVEGCDAEIVHVAKHIRRKHEIKYWGYQCECGYQSTPLDYGIFVRHRRVKHKDRSMAKEKLSRYRTNIKDGYYDTLRCEKCPFRGFAQEDMDKHTCEPDPEESPKKTDAKQKPQKRSWKQSQQGSNQWKQQWNQGWGNEDYGEGWGNEGWGNEGWGNEGWGNEGWGNEGWGNEGWGNGSGQWDQNRRGGKRRRQDYDQGTPKNPCPHGCDGEFTNVDAHVKRVHTLKYKYYKCECGFHLTELDGDRFKTHRARHHGASRFDNLSQFEVHIREGYMHLQKCPNCAYRCVTNEDMSKHSCQAGYDHYDYIKAMKGNGAASSAPVRKAGTNSNSQPAPYRPPPQQNQYQGYASNSSSNGQASWGTSYPPPGAYQSYNTASYSGSAQNASYPPSSTPSTASYPPSSTSSYPQSSTTYPTSSTWSYPQSGTQSYPQSSMVSYPTSSTWSYPQSSTASGQSNASYNWSAYYASGAYPPPPPPPEGQQPAYNPQGPWGSGWGSIQKPAKS